MCVLAALPFVVHPQQVRSEDDGDVSGRHFVHVLMFAQFGEEFDQIPDGTKHTPDPSVGTRNGKVTPFTARLEVNLLRPHSHE